MKPTHSILDNSFRYVPATATSVSDTWSRFGWRPASQERRQREVARWLQVRPGDVDAKPTSGKA